MQFCNEIDRNISAWKGADLRIDFIYGCLVTVAYLPYILYTLYTYKGHGLVCTTKPHIIVHHIGGCVRPPPEEEDSKIIWLVLDTQYN